MEQKTQANQTILIVDDKLERIYTRVLRGAGSKILVATSEGDANDIIYKEKITAASIDSLDNGYHYPPQPKRFSEIGNTIARNLRYAHRGARILGLSAFPEQFNQEYFDFIFSKSEIDPLTYRELLSGKKEKLDENKKRILLISKDREFEKAIKENLEYKVDVFSRMPERSEFDSYNIIIADSDLEKSQLIHALWNIKELESYEFVPIYEIDPVLARLITIKPEEKQKDNIKICKSLNKIIKKA